MKSITVKPDKITDLAKEGEAFIFKPEAEEALIELLMLKELIDTTIDEVKDAIGKAGKDINPNFKGVIGDTVRCTYRKYGGKYKYDWGKKSMLDPFLDEKTRYYVNTESVDAYVKEVGELPDGISEVDREDKLTITRKE